MHAHPIDEPIALDALRRAVRRLKRGLRSGRSRWAARHLSAALAQAADHATVLRFPEDSRR